MSMCKERNTDGLLNYNQTLALRGIAAFEIMLGHLGIATGYSFLFPSRKAGILFVGVFFFLSGYGLMCKLNHYKERKNAYFKNFIIRRTILILWPVYFTYFIHGVLEIFMFSKYNTKEIIRYIFLYNFLERTNWYVFEILVFYVMFYFLYKFLPKKVANLILITATFGFIFLAFLLEIDNPWYGSSLCFPLGILCVQRECKWNEFIKKRYWVKNGALLLVCCTCIVLYFWLGNRNIIGNPIARNLAALSFCVWILLLLQKVNLDFRVFRWLGKISYEIFLLHLMWISILKEAKIRNDYLLISCIVLTLITAQLIHIPDKKVAVWINTVADKTDKVDMNN